MSDEIQFTELGNIGLVTLNRPQALNALTHSMIIDFYEQLIAWETDDAIKAIIVQGAGEKAFCAGGDIRKIYDERNNTESDIHQFFWDEYRLNYRIKHYPKPYIALLDGITMGGGVGVSIHGNYRIATERFSFAMPETSIGFFPDVGGSYFLPRCPGQTGIYLGLTGARIKSADAAYLDLITHYVPTERMPELIDCITTNFLGANATQVIENLIHTAAHPAGDAELAAHRNDIDYCFKQDGMEEILNALTQRDTEWCSNVKKTLLTKSPTSLKVTLRELRNGKQLNFDQCLQMEYRMVQRFLTGHDFYEGVRAVLVDKDQTPKWQPAELSTVTKEMVDAYFAPLQDKDELVFN